MNAHPAAELPALDAATEAALRASIKRFGVLVPVIVDQDGEILDGNNRVRIAGEFDMSYPTHVIEVPDDADVQEVLLSLNDDRRPRLTLEQRREVVAALREEGHSQRAIAGAIGWSRKVVRTDLKQVGPEAHLPEQTTGIDGKTYPAKQSKKPAPERRGFRKNRDQPFEITTSRHAEVALANKRKLANVLAAIDGYRRALEDFDLGIAIAGADTDDLAAWERLAGEAVTAFSALKRALKEARNGTHG